MESNNKENLTITLKDGRKLGYAEFGDSSGKPVFHFHGYPGSRLEATLIADKIAQKDVRLISIDRPGMGLSDFKVNRAILDWPDDVVELADALGINKFAVEGISGGGPYAAVCAYKIPDRLTACAIIGGVGPPDFSREGMSKSNRRLMFFVRRFYWLFKLIMKFQSRGFKNLEKMEKNMKKNLHKLPEPDQEILGDPKILPLFLKEGAESFRQGSKGVAHDGKLYMEDWNFNPEEISPKVRVTVWHGELDANVPVSMGRAMCEAIPNCEGNFYPNEGHYSIAFNYIEKIIENLIS